jgi:phosphatidylserine/phosphatidylglycerophosphate/cardiolipin synthase-like enzyme
MPPGTNLASPAYPFDRVELLVDRTAWDPERGQYVREHQIFDAVLREIREAETFLIVDFFLWNPWKGVIGEGETLRPLSTELAAALIEKQVQSPDMPIVVITDPLNRIYGAHAPEFFSRLAQAGIPVIYTALDQLPESNKLYAPQAWFWSKFLPAEKPDARRRVPNPIDPEGMQLTLAELSRLLYFKANHRKMVISGRRGAPTRILMPSLNPADGSANHSNIGVLVDGPVARFAAQSELAIARWSASQEANVVGARMPDALRRIDQIEHYLKALPVPPQAGLAEPSVAYRSEGAIRDEIILQFQKSVSGTRIDIGMFYFSDRGVMEALLAAIRRGANVRVLLDANRDAFGREKNGIPNRIIAAELMELSGAFDVEVRWAATHGEQFHSKVLRISGPQQEILFLGSANWTRRNLANLNLEANLLLAHAAPVNRAFDAYFDSVWNNREGFEESLPYDAFAETGWSLRWKTWLYRFQEWSGASTF